MGKSTILFVVILVAGAVGMIFIHGDVRAEQEQTRYDELAVYGDVSAAEGLQIKEAVQAFYHLKWDITNRLGKEHSCDTVFTFSQEQLEIDSGNLYNEITLTIAGGDLDISGDAVTIEELYQGALSEPIQRIIDDTPDGEIHSDTIMFEDYCEYYPLEISVYKQGNEIYLSEDFPEEMAKISDYFRIPVVKGSWLKVTVTKAADGSVTQISTLLSFSDKNIWTNSDGTGDITYFTLSGEGDWDYSYIKGGYGIYTLEVKENNGYVGDVSMKYALDPSAKVYMLNAPEDIPVLELVTQEGEDYYLSVIDRNSWKLKQKLSLDMDEYPQMIQYDKLTLYTACNAQYMDLVIRHEDEDYELIRIPAALDEKKWNDENKEYLGFEMDSSLPADAVGLAWDGSRLALLWAAYGWNCPATALRANTGYVAAVYDQEGLQYAGAYLCSLEDRQIGEVGDTRESITFYSDLSSMGDNTFAVSWD